MAAALAAFAAPADGWKHGVYRDGLDGTEWPYAVIHASSGSHEAVLRISKRSDLAVELLVSNAVCHADPHGGFYCPGRYRFDDGSVEGFSGYAGDNPANGVMLLGTDEVIRKLRPAKRLRIQLEFVGEAPVTFDFHWDKFPF